MRKIIELKPAIDPIQSGFFLPKNLDLLFNRVISNEYRRRQNQARQTLSNRS
jgi:hypothetical protein